MPSSYTTSLRLTLPATGELGGQWGSTVNTGITELLDAAVAGTASISTWGGAGVAYTLSSTNGAADEARKMFIVATGTPGEAKNVICPAVSKFYVFRNDTTGGFALTLKTGSGTGIAVPAGQYRFLYCDGTNVVEAFNSAAAIALSGNLTLNGGTANGVLYLNGSKVATSGSALTWDGTSIGMGNPTVYGTRSLNSYTGTTASAIGFSQQISGFGDAWVGSNNSGSSVLGMATGTFGQSTPNNIPWTVSAFGSEQMRLTSTGLGIGTSSPAQKLHVYGGNLQISNAAGSTTYIGPADGLITSGSNTATAIRFENGYLGFAYSTTELLRLTASGNLGLGVTPSVWGGGYKAIQFPSGGIGSYSTSSTAYAQNAYDSGAGAWKYMTSGAAAGLYNQSLGSHAWYTAPSGTAGNTISFTQALTLHASGGMSLGNTTDPGATNLSVTGTITSGKGANVASAATVTLGAGNFFDITGTTTISNITIKPAGTVVYLKFDNTLTLQTGTIGSSGAMRLTGGASLGVTQYDVLTLISDGTNWWQVAYNNN